MLQPHFRLHRNIFCIFRRLPNSTAVYHHRCRVRLFRWYGGTPAARIVSHRQGTRLISRRYHLRFCARCHHLQLSLTSHLSPLTPYLAFVLAAFSALRLAKFNLDERQALGFIGLPTPANALFWGALIGGLHGNHVYFEGMEWCIIAGLLISCFLLVCELPMFALKFKTWGWKGNEIKYIFLLTCIPMLFFGIFGLAAIIAWYVILSVVNTYLLKNA